jgi:hypothetical protein
MRLETLLSRYPGATPVFADDPPLTVRVIAPPAAAPVASKSALGSRIFSPAQAAALASPAVAARPAKPAVTKAAPKRVPFERALATVCGPRPGLSVPWHLPASEKPAQATPP